MPFNKLLCVQGGDALKFLWIRLFLYFVFFISPVLTRYSCSSSGGAGSYVAAECYIDIPLMYSYANLVTGFLMLNFYTAFIPLLVYICVIPFLIEIIISLCKKHLVKSHITS